MLCPACRHPNPEGARFCNRCGTPLGGASSEQLTTLRAFIPADVAEKILAAPGMGERRTVTVLFTDVVNSTPLGERLGAERFKIVMDQLLGRIITAVSRYEGTVAQVVGDGVLAFFGAPLAHEDDPERAALAALAIREAVETYARDLEGAYGVTLQVRVGLHTGAVVLSHVTDVLQVAYNALGDSVTTAARLQTAAAPGTILASEVTGRLLAPLFELRPVGPLVLKGKAAPEAAVEVVGRRPVMGKARGVEGLRAPLVGRDRELATLAAAIGVVLEGVGQIVTVVGEAGIGKSRLLEEAQLRHPPLRWLEGRSLSYSAGIPYSPFVDLFREWLEVGPGDPDAKVRIELRTALERLFPGRGDEVYPFLGGMLRLPLEGDAAARIAHLSAESLQHQTFKLIREWATVLARERPLALVLDDVHWADDTSLSLLEALLPATEEAALLLCPLFRPEREHPAWRLNEVARQRFPHRHVEIVLTPLTPEDTQELVTQLLTLPDFPPEIRDLILQKAEGNPFFVEEVIRELIEAGMLVREGERWRAGRAVRMLDIPDNVQGVLLSRIDRLPEPARRVLQAAAVIGRLFPLDVLTQIVPLNGAVEGALLDLQRHDLIVERRRIPQPEYRFKHVLTQEVAYDSLTERERQRLHGEVARALEARHAGRLEEVYGLLAYHYDLAEEDERAVDFLVRAADKARTEYADVEALRHYGRAGELMKQMGQLEPAASTLMKVALAHHIAFDFAAANRAYQEAFSLLARLPVPQARPKTATLRWAFVEPLDVDTVRAGDAPSMIVAGQVFEGLLRYAPGMNVVPAAARSWEISPDGTRYRFSLHQNRRWSDGRPVTAHDFVYAWVRAMRGVNAHFLHDIAGARRYHEGQTDDPATVGVRAPDDYTLEVTLEGPRAYFPYILAHPVTSPHPRWAVERFADAWTHPDHLVTNGPFVITEWVHGDHLRLTRNPYFAGIEAGNIAEVWVYGTPPDVTPFTEGRVDVQLVTAALLGNLEAVHPHLHVEPPIRTAFVWFRCDQPPFDDRRLRLALAHATDRRALAAAAPSLAVPALGGLVAPPFPGHSPDIGVPFDPASARRLLAEAGFPEGKGLEPLRLLMPQGIDEVLYRALAPMWKEVLNVDLHLVVIPAHEYWASPRGLGGIGRSAWIPDYPDPDNFLRVTHHSTAANNLARWRNERFDRLIEEAQGLTDHRRRMALYHEADRLLVTEEVAIIPIAYTRAQILVSPRVRGWWSSLIGGVPLSDLIVSDRE